MMLGERLAQGRPPDAQQQVGDDRLDALVGRQLLEIDRARSRAGPPEERGELLRERQEILGGGRARSRRGTAPPALGVGGDPDRESRPSRWSRSTTRRASAPHHAVDVWAAPVGGPVDENGHRDYASS